MRLRTVSILFVVALFLVSLIAGISHIISVADVPSYPQILDQQQTDASRDVNPYSYAQSFKPTLSVLTRVDLYIDRSFGLEIYSSTITESGLRPAQWLGSTHVIITDRIPSWRWAEFVFSHPICLLPEDTYFIIVRPPNLTGSLAARISTIAVRRMSFVRARAIQILGAYGKFGLGISPSKPTGIRQP